MLKEKKDIRKLDLAALKEVCLEANEKAFRAKQIYEWLWKKAAHSFEEMTNLSKDFRTYLETHYVINAVTIDLEQKSQDGTVKLRFKLHDDHMIEGVLIPADERMTACISSQVGCSLTCKFCATGQMKRIRNIDDSEIFDQVVLINRLSLEHYNQPLSNIVYMGMGEPLLNYAQVLKSVERLTAPEGLDMSPKRITLSTAGIAKMIRKLGDDDYKGNLALSLHAANDQKRSDIMPINDQNNLAALSEALQYFYKKTRTRVTFEYIIFKDRNDELEDARELARFCRKVPCKVNIIEYNPIAGADFLNTSEKKLVAFQQYLMSEGVTVTVRRSRGKDIDAACGQLANKE